ncbi:hypothetical protein JCM10213_001458, partial [Rhodosporidiobolus nylandii]
MRFPRPPPSQSSSSSDPISSPLPLLTRELHHHRRLSHPHLLQLYELLATESSIFLITELCAGGELFSYLLDSPGGRLSIPEARRVFGQLCLGVGYLHAEGVVHRDLKLENVLLDEWCNVKIADLGFAREVGRGGGVGGGCGGWSTGTGGAAVGGGGGGGGSRWMETRVGTVGYTAPEVLRGEKYVGE